ncbi:hypothetical protein ABC304_16190 [Microbacterium sp. 1P10UB]|uniref:hypothetical protein n=1 Tax=unclassified Microbacterium TaxID=2609290 RepID=UPI0039A01EBF
MTAPSTLSSPVAASLHEHAWVTESTHATSAGRVRYVRCIACPARRIDLDPVASSPPAAITQIVGEAGRR